MGHSEQEEAPVPLNCPAAQLSHAVEQLADENCPAMQLVQAAVPNSPGAQQPLTPDPERHKEAHDSGDQALKTRDREGSEPREHGSSSLYTYLKLLT